MSRDVCGACYDEEESEEVDEEGRHLGVSVCKDRNMSAEEWLSRAGGLGGLGSWGS